jgi:hypothetical protein
MSEKTRIILFILMFVLIGTIPWWLTAIFLLILTIYIPFYPEIIFFGFLIDVLFYSGNTLFSPGLTLSLLVYVIINLVRTRIRT